MAIDMSFTEEEMAVDCGLGYPRAYAKLCRDRSFGPYSHGPPFTFTPYSLQPHQAARAKDLDEMFPIIDPKARPTAKPKIFASLLWKQLNHLGNAGFDPTTFRVDTYGNVLYYYADSASPLAWDVDHWFPYSRGGLTVPSNLRILQGKVCKKKHNKLEFLIPWWDFQEGISINQFLSIFASSNSDFRHKAFSHLFLHGESEELNDSQTVDSHVFPQHFTQLKEQVGLAPAAIVVSRRESFDSSSTLKSYNINRQPQSESSILAERRVKTSMYKENENPEIVTNPYQAIVMARDSLIKREETTKMQGEISNLDGEVNELRHKTEEEKVAIQDLELVLIKKRRRAEKCRKLAEAQSSYRAMLEKMIRDTMHQSVIYKQQIRLNEAAASALMARLEAQKAICDSSERELHRKFRQRDELETQTRPDWDQARKRSRIGETLFDKQEDDKSILHLRGNEPRTLLKKSDDASLDEKDDKKTEKTVLCLPGIEERQPPPLHKELRVFLEEEHKASEAGFSPNEGQERKKIEGGGGIEECNKAIVAADEKSIEEKLQKLEIVSTGKIYNNIQVPITCEPEQDEDEESRKQRGKGNVEKWLQMLLKDTKESGDQNLEYDDGNSKIDELNLICPQKETKVLRFPGSQNPQVRENEDHYIKTQEAIQEKHDGKAKEEIVENEDEHAFLLKNPPPYKLESEKKNPNNVGSVGKGVGSSSSFEGQERGIKSEKERGLVRCESARTFRQIPSSPSIILGMRKGVNCIRKKPLVIGDDEEEEEEEDRAVAGNNFIKSFSIKSIKKAVKI